jgi:hypothetical protein
LSAKAGALCLSLDLRRDQSRIVETGFRGEQLFFAQVLRGVVDGTLERVLVDYLAGSSEATNAPLAPALSTSLVFERARALNAPTAMLASGGAGAGNDVPANSRARIDGALASGYVVLAPMKPIEVAGAPRFAWWQIDPRSGTTTAVTDEALHQATVEVGIIKEKDGSATVWTTVRGTDLAKASRFDSQEQAIRFIIKLQDAMKTMKGVSSFSWVGAA